MVALEGKEAFQPSFEAIKGQVFGAADLSCRLSTVATTENSNDIATNKTRDESVIRRIFLRGPLFVCSFVCLFIYSSAHLRRAKFFIRPLPFHALNFNQTFIQVPFEPYFQSHQQARLTCFFTLLF